MKVAGSNRRSSPLAFPTSDQPGSGLGLQPSPHQIGAQAGAASHAIEGFGDMATNRQTLAQLVPTTTKDRLAGAAVQGLKKAAGI